MGIRASDSISRNISPTLDDFFVSIVRHFTVSYFGKGLSRLRLRHYIQIRFDTIGYCQNCDRIFPRHLRFYTDIARLFELEHPTSEVWQFTRRTIVLEPPSSCIYDHCSAIGNSCRRRTYRKCRSFSLFLFSPIPGNYHINYGRHD